MVEIKTTVGTYPITLYDQYWFEIPEGDGIIQEIIGDANKDPIVEDLKSFISFPFSYLKLFNQRVTLYMSEELELGYKFGNKWYIVSEEGEMEEVNEFSEDHFCMLIPVNLTPAIYAFENRDGLTLACIDNYGRVLWENNIDEPMVCKLDKGFQEYIPIPTKPGIFPDEINYTADNRFNQMLDSSQTWTIWKAYENYPHLIITKDEIIYGETINGPYLNLNTRQPTVIKPGFFWALAIKKVHPNMVAFVKNNVAGYAWPGGMIDEPIEGIQNQTVKISEDIPLEVFDGLLRTI